MALLAFAAPSSSLMRNDAELTRGIVAPAVLLASTGLLRGWVSVGLDVGGLAMLENVLGPSPKMIVDQYVQPSLLTADRQKFASRLWTTYLVGQKLMP